jgi:hypothetical protein
MNNKQSQVPVASTYNPSYLGSWYKEDQGQPRQIVHELLPLKQPGQKWTEGRGPVLELRSPEFKIQYLPPPKKEQKLADSKRDSIFLQEANALCVSTQFDSTVFWAYT